MRLELSGTGIHIILIEPGPIRTHIRMNSYPHFKQWIDWQSSAFKTVYRQVVIPRLTATDNEPPNLFELTPDAVSAVIIEACEVAHPKLRYRVTAVTKIAWLLKRLLPTKLLDRLLVRL